MALKAVVDAIPEGMNDYYIEDNGRFRLNVEAVGGLSLEDVGGLKKVLADVRADREKLRVQVDKYGDLDPEAARTAIDAMGELEELRKLDPKSEADKIAQAKIDAATKNLGRRHAAEVEGLQAKNAKLMSTVDDVLRKQAATKALSDAKGSVDLLLPHVMGKTKVVESGGQFSVEILDDYGTPRMGTDGKPLTLADFVAEMRANETFGRAFEPSGNTGSGKGPTSGGGTAGAIARAQFEALTPAAKMAHVTSGGTVT